MPRLTEKMVADLTVPEGTKDRLVFDDLCRGLGMRITAKSKTFLVQWQHPIRKQKVREPLGKWPTLTVTQARDAARVKLGVVAKGGDPRAERIQAQQQAEREKVEKALTFEALVDKWAMLHLAKMRHRYRTEAVRAIKMCLAHLLKRPASRITKVEAVEALDELLKAGKPGMAAKTLSYARAAFMWAEKRGTVANNPFRGLPDPPKTEARDRVLNDDEVAAIWAASLTLGYPWEPFFQLLILTLQRREEVAGALWSEIDFDNRVWRIAGNRMKNGKPHDVHLTDAAIAVLQDIPRLADCDFIFTTTGKTHVSGYSKAKGALDAAIVKATGESLQEWVPHDLRRTGVSTLARLGFDSVVVDRLLAHQPAKLSAVARIYQRHDFARERAAALDIWAAHVTGVERDNVMRPEFRRSAE